MAERLPPSGPPGEPAFPARFEALRRMGPFTEAMFNRIIAFQERQHPAWDPARPFEERIRGLPLHYLVFSHPERDPARFGPTVAPYFPLREELARIADYARQAAGERPEGPLALDCHAGNGFVGSLLAREGVRVLGLRDPAAKPNQIRDFYDPERYELQERSLEEAVAAGDLPPVDLAFSSWMPAGRNLTPQILALAPKLVVFVHTDHVHPETGQPQTGTPEAFRELPGYRLEHAWTVTRPKDLFHAIWPDLTPCIEEVRQVKVYAREDLPGLRIPDAPPAVEPYDWEEELAMALLAHEARAWLEGRGEGPDGGPTGVRGG